MAQQVTQTPTLTVQPGLPTPVKLRPLAKLLFGHPPDLVQSIISGFSIGFPLHFQGRRQFSIPNNLLSALQNPTFVDTKLEQELAAERIAGPFTSPPFQSFCVSPLGLIPKKTPGDFRLIHHLSFPKGLSINDGIFSEDTHVRYATVADAIKLIKRAGLGCYLAKTDIKSAFRIIPIHPNDYPLSGMKWCGLYYYDRCMPMGCSSSCKTFETFSTAIEWIARHKLKIDELLHLLDDFLFVSATYMQCQSSLNLFIGLCHQLGIPIAPDKTFGPSTTLTFAGIELDSVKFEARLPRDKIAKCVDTINLFLKGKKVRLQELQSLIGLLNFATSVITPGIAFLRRLYDLTHGVKSPHHLIRLGSESKADLRVWLTFLASFNGVYLFRNENWENSVKLKLFTDAAGSIGFGAIFGDAWCYGRWPEKWLHRNIAILEFFPIVLSLCLWGEKMRNHSILFFTDNEALVHVINKQSCRDKTLMIFVRKLVLVCLEYNILFKAKHIPGAHNILADSLSRLQVHKFKQLAPSSMKPLPTDTPLHLQPQSWAI